MHRQLAAILANRLGRRHAQLLSRPELAVTDDAVSWYSELSGPVRMLADLSEAERRPIETLRRQLLADIAELVRKMKGEGDSAELAAHTLELAVTTPPDGADYVVGAHPVLVLWGHAAEGQAVPEAPTLKAPSATPIAATLPLAEAVAETPAEPVTAAQIAPVFGEGYSGGFGDCRRHGSACGRTATWGLACLAPAVASPVVAGLSCLAGAAAVIADRGRAAGAGAATAGRSAAGGAREGESALGGAGRVD